MTIYKICELCGGSFTSQGLPNHMRNCDGVPKEKKEKKPKVETPQYTAGGYLKDPSYNNKASPSVGHVEDLDDELDNEDIDDAEGEVEIKTSSRPSSHEIHEEIKTTKHDFGVGTIITVLVVILALALLLVRVRDPLCRTDYELPEKKDNFSGVFGDGS